jgi:hypothetical protein
VAVAAKELDEVAARGGAGRSLGLRRCAGEEMVETPGGSRGRKHGFGADDDWSTRDV